MDLVYSGLLSDYDADGDLHLFSPSTSRMPSSPHLGCALLGIEPMAWRMLVSTVPPSHCILSLFLTEL